VIVDGRIVVEDGQATGIANEEVVAKASRSARSMASRIGIHVGSSWSMSG
jgi:hypothetical protein